ncbi:hypothetical protein JG688_00006532 [Phytophthora aleatoria]|uniref:WRKY19-like zinc finger domain-containing protein n=1 Tax=Phytophthora aleatoria TaxID=2496075 RepID=A0A8J5MGW9_9STRA|nr:hypothetical protein JG688_00006532 [Phytophthora aleatoria]
MTRNDTASARSPRTAKRRHRCEFPGCTTPSRRRGLCFRHGGFTLCSVMGCAKPSSTHGLCFAHGGVTPCLVSGCSTPSAYRGLCCAHEYQ